MSTTTRNGVPDEPVRLLLLEDSRADANLLLRVLERAGLVVESEVVDTREAFEAGITAFAPNLIVSDYTIPGFDGASALALARERCPEVPFVFVSGTIGEERAVEAMRMGASDYVVKDRLARLPHAVQQALRHAAERRLRKESQHAAAVAAEKLRRGELFATLGKLVAGVAHEVRTPLFSISATLDAFEARWPLPDDARVYVERLRGDVERLNRLMSDLLAYGRSGRAERRPAAWRFLVAQAVRLAQNALRARGVTVAEAIPANLPLVTVDCDGMVEALHNLIDNAIHHSSAGATIRVSAARAERDGKDGIECRVEDSGPGFRDTELGRVFEPFYSRRKGGTGLGLSIVERHVEEHGGRVEAANRPEGGAVVTLWMPISSAGEAAAPLEPAPGR